MIAMPKKVIRSVGISNIPFVRIKKALKIITPKPKPLKTDVKGRLLIINSAAVEKNRNGISDKISSLNRINDGLKANKERTVNKA
jgi:hypothetical protein